MPELAHEFNVIINGQPAPPDLVRNLTEIVVDDSLYLPDMFTLRIHDSDMVWVDAELLSVGAEVEIWATAADQGAQPGASGRLIQGEITALAPNFGAGAPTLTVRGYDHSHRLHRGKKSRSFLQVTDSEVAQRIAQEAKLRFQVEATTVVHEYLFQDNQTDLEFLQARAQNIGYQVYVKDKTLYFVKRESEQEQGPELEWGRNLRDFRPRLSTMNQVDEVIVRGWDPQRKEEIVSRASESQIAPHVGVAESGAELAQRAFGVAAQLVVSDRPVANVEEANAMAQALCDEVGGDFIKARGVCLGDPRVKAGCMIAIRGIGMRFSGQYFITSATHVQDENGYETLFNISGRKPDTLSALLQRGGGKGWGIAVGLVTNNRDSAGLGRVKVKFPWLSESEQSAWARMAAPMAGPDKGFYCLPEINDEVLVAFEHGQIKRPYILGVLWNGKDHPPQRNDQVVGRDGKVNRYILRSRSGHQIILDDTAGGERIIIRDQTGQNEIVIDSKRNDMTIKAKGNLTIEAGGEVRIRSNRDLSIEAGGKGEIKAQDVTVDGGARVDVKGGVINLN